MRKIIYVVTGDLEFFIAKITRMHKVNFGFVSSGLKSKLERDGI